MYYLYIYIYRERERERLAVNPPGLTVLLACVAEHLTRSNSNARNTAPSQSFSFKRKCLTTSARESFREALISPGRSYFALGRIEASINSGRVSLSLSLRSAQVRAYDDRA